ncbi:hypothetical protein MMC07_008549 [Pseudocyphellaria aurata]|nr:hypothetical protein [Pseudocyphellaria aurata]
MEPDAHETTAGSQSVGNQPIANQPDASQPDTSQPDASQPVANQLVANQPVISTHDRLGLLRLPAEIRLLTYRHQPVVNQLVANQLVTNQLVANQPVISTHDRLGLLSLPAEIRLLIYRHLLVRPWPLEIEGRFGGLPPPVEILRTNRQVYREAFDVLYRENEFVNRFRGLSPRRYLTRFRRLVDTIQNIHIDVPLRLVSPHIGNFLWITNHFAGSSITRGTLTVLMIFRGSMPTHSAYAFVNVFVIYLRRATNFRTVHLHVSENGEFDRRFDHLEHIERRLHYALGPPEFPIHDGNGLRYHPVDHFDRLRRLDHDI